MALKTILPNSIYQQSAIENAPFKPYVWWRFIDDIFMVWTEGEDNLQTFLHHLNSIHPTITFAHEYSNSSHQSLPFLYVQDHLDNSLIETDLHTKPRDKRHPAHRKPCLTTASHPRGGGEGYFRNFWVGMSRLDPGTLNLYQS